MYDSNIWSAIFRNGAYCNPQSNTNQTNSTNLYSEEFMAGINNPSNNLAQNNQKRPQINPKLPKLAPIGQSRKKENYEYPDHINYNIDYKGNYKHKKEHYDKNNDYELRREYLNKEKSPESPLPEVPALDFIKLRFDLFKMMDEDILNYYCAFYNIDNQYIINNLKKNNFFNRRKRGKPAQW